MLYLSWRYGGEDPYRLYNGAEARPEGPKHEGRYRAFIYACGIFAMEREIELAGGKPRGAKG